MKSRHKDAKKASSQHKVTSLLIENWILASQVIWKIHYSHNHIMTLAIGKVTIIGLIISQTVSNVWYARTSGCAYCADHSSYTDARTSINADQSHTTMLLLLGVGDLGLLCARMQ